MKMVSVKLPEPLAAWVSRRSRELNRTQSQVVREVLERERNGTHRSTNCAERLRDLGGFFDGPKDLSTNPEHLAELGR
jgi:hypothetical protein